MQIMEMPPEMAKNPYCCQRGQFLMETRGAYEY